MKTYTLTVNGVQLKLIFKGAERAYLINAFTRKGVSIPVTQAQKLLQSVF